MRNDMHLANLTERCSQVSRTITVSWNPSEEKCFKEHTITTVRNVAILILKLRNDYWILQNGNLGGEQ